MIASLEAFLAAALPTLAAARNSNKGFYQDYQDYLTLREEYLRQRDAHRYFAERCPRGTALAVSESRWAGVSGQWDAVSEGLTQWSRRLEAHLPGELSGLVAWLAAGETLMGAAVPSPPPRPNPITATAATAELEDLHLRSQVRKDFCSFASVPAVAGMAEQKTEEDIVPWLEVMGVFGRVYCSRSCSRRLCLRSRKVVSVGGKGVGGGLLSK